MTISFANQSSLRMMRRPATIEAARRMSALRQLAPDGRLRGAGFCFVSFGGVMSGNQRKGRAEHARNPSRSVTHDESLE